MAGTHGSFNQRINQIYFYFLFGRIEGMEIPKNMEFIYLFNL